MKRKLPKIGETRKIKRFLITPRTIKRTWRWLEMSTIKQEYQKNYDENSGAARWVDVKWVK